jgi:hypothetical protein
MDKMEFAKYYNATGILNKMLEEDNKLFAYQKDYCQGLYICMDTHDFWVCRILDGYNEEFEQEEGSWLVERNKIDKYDLLEFVKENYKKLRASHVSDRNTRDWLIDTFKTKKLIEYVILYDDDKGLEGWDNTKCDSLEECIKVIDGGFGIIELTA